MSRTAKRRANDERIVRKRLKTPQNTRFIPTNSDAVWFDPSARSKLRDSKLIYRRCRCAWCMSKYKYKNDKSPQIKDYEL